MTQEMIIGTLAFAALAAVIIFRNKPITTPTVEIIDASQTSEPAIGPSFLTYNQPWQFALPVTPIPNPAVPLSSMGQVGQSGCATC